MPSTNTLATDIAEHLIRKGTLLSKYITSSCHDSSPASGLLFRETNHFTGRVVALAGKEGVPMDKLLVHSFKVWIVGSVTIPWKCLIMSVLLR
jgi:hypothetical protein